MSSVDHRSFIHLLVHWMFWMISTNANERTVRIFFSLTEGGEKLNKYSTVSIDIRHFEMEIVNSVDVLIKWNTTNNNKKRIIVLRTNAKVSIIISLIRKNAGKLRKYIDHYLKKFYRKREKKRWWWWKQTVFCTIHD